MWLFIFLNTMHIVPFIISSIIINELIVNNEPEKIFGIQIISQSIAFIGNLLSICILYPLNFNRHGFLYVLKMTLNGEIAYQEMELILKCLLLCTLGAFIYAVLINRIFLCEILRLSYEKSGKVVRAILLALVLIECIPGIITAELSNSAMSHLSIDEICRKEEIESEEGTTEYSYVVIKNDGKYPQMIDELYLSTDKKLSDAMCFDNIFISGVSTIVLKKEYEDFLDIKKKGGTKVYLSDSEGTILDIVEVAALGKNESYKKNNESEEWEVIGNYVEEQIVEEPILSHESGFYKASFKLTLTSLEGNDIYYTTDGSNPSVESKKYTDPIYVYNRSDEENIYRNESHVIYNYLSKWEEPEKVDKAFIIRAIAVDEEGNSSEIISATYFVDLEKYENTNIISLIVEPDDLFGENGIYVTGPKYDEEYESIASDEEREQWAKDISNNNVTKINYMNSGIDWERLANFEYFIDGNLATEQNIGIRIQGASARHAALKRFSLYSRKQYDGNKYFDYDFFENTYKSHSLVLREGFLNAFTQSIVTDRDVSTLKSIPVTVFINGEYWYDVYLQEKYSEEYFADYYGVTTDNVIISKANMLDELITYFTELDFKNQEDYEEFKKYVDVQSYIDCYCINLYLGNTDLKDNKNVVMWKTEKKVDQEYGDTRWRWALFDMDLGIGGLARHYGLNNDAEFNTFNSVSELNTKRAFNDSVVFKKLKTSEEFCNNFVITFMDMANSYFAVDRMSDLLEKWGQDISYMNYYFQERPYYIVDYMAEEFDLQGTKETVTIKMDDISAGSIVLNTIEPELMRNDNSEELEGYTWSGLYYTDYPISLSVKPNCNYEFDKWVVTTSRGTKTYTEDTIALEVCEGGMEVYAIFK